MSGARILLGALLVALVAIGSGSCSSDGFCLDCAEDASLRDGATNNSDAAVDGDGAPLQDASFADACINSGVEQCDGLDNDCDLAVDEGVLNGVGLACSTNVGECVEGVTECTDGAIVCGGGVVPTFEICDGLDNDCNGTVDDNNPGGGAVCGSNVGECVAGFVTCNGGVVECIGSIGGSAETCDGLDNDCDSSFDENVPSSGSCGPTTDTGLCTFGSLECVGGGRQCIGAVYPQVEQCDELDQDCDGNPINGFNLATDAANCGACGNVCVATNAFASCGAGACAIAACVSGYFDNNGNYSDGCEFGPCNFNGAETCNGQDDDCDGDIDENLNLNPPALCDSDGECSGTVAQCTSGAWVCSYPATVSVDLNGDIVPETVCDDLDNDCDGNIDEFFVTKGNACDDGEVGACLDSGALVCNGSGNGVVCSAIDDDVTGDPEVCDGVDNDCNGLVDDGDLAAWVDFGAAEMFQFEASRPDANSSSEGFDNGGIPCSKANALPWTNLTHPQATAACASIGARLCTETEWLAACETASAGGKTQTGSNGLIYFEAEDFDNRVAGSTAQTGTPPDEWELNSNIGGFSGTGFLFADDDDGTGISPANAIANAPRLDYNVTFTQTGTHYVWVRIYADDSNDDRLHIGLDGAIPAGGQDIDTDFNDSWYWMRETETVAVATLNVATVGAHTINIYMRDDGMRIDKILLTTDASYVPVGSGPPVGVCQWSYQNECLTYDPDVCNGEDYDSDPTTAGDQDRSIPTGSAPMCYADWGEAGGIHDLSGNIKEWTAERTSDVNPIRGGSYNNNGIGTSCQFDFLTADDTFFFPNVGFRCCRDAP